MGVSTYFQFSVSVAATLWVLISASDILQPMLIALFVWLLISVTATQYARGFAAAGVSAPRLAKLLGALTILVSLVIFGAMLSDSAATVFERLPEYEARLDSLIVSAASALGVESRFSISETLSNIDMSDAAVNFAGSAANAVTSLIIIAVYIIFINQEAGTLEAKVAALLAGAEQRERVTQVGVKVLGEVETYVGVKVILGIVQAAPTFAVLSYLGVEAPIFWAAMIFLFSFIPTIGTMVGIVFPSLMALVQFDTLTPFFTVLAILVPVQLVASNYLEPKLMSRSLNISPLAVFFGIFAGGALWGIVGALIVVPLIATGIIVFSRIPSMRPVAILLSGDGKLPEG